MKYWILLLALTAGVGHAASPVKPVNVAAAEAFRKELRTVMDENTKALMEPAPNRAHIAKLKAVRAKAEQLFGDVWNPQYGSCVKAAGMVETMWTDQVTLASGGATSIKVGTLATASFNAGVEYFACRTAIDALTPPVAAECLMTYDLAKPGATAPTLPSHCKKVS